MKRVREGTEKRVRQTARLLTLPPELLAYILSFLDMITRFRSIPRVSFGMNHLAITEKRTSVAPRVDFNTFIDFRSFLHHGLAGAKIQTLSFVRERKFKAPLMDARELELIRDLGFSKLEVVTGHMPLPISLFGKMIPPELRTLEFYNMGLYSFDNYTLVVNVLASVCAAVDKKCFTELSVVSDNEVSGFDDDSPEADALKDTWPRNLTTLQLGYPMNQACAVFVTTNSPLLRRLDLDIASSFDAKALPLLPNLEFLSLSFCADATRVSMTDLCKRVPKVIDLSLMELPRNQPVNKEDLGHLPEQLTRFAIKAPKSSLIASSVLERMHKLTHFAVSVTDEDAKGKWYGTVAASETERYMVGVLRCLSKEAIGNLEVLMLSGNILVRAEDISAILGMKRLIRASADITFYAQTRCWSVVLANAFYELPKLEDLLLDHITDYSPLTSDAKNTPLYINPRVSHVSLNLGPTIKLAPSFCCLLLNVIDLYVCRESGVHVDTDCKWLSGLFKQSKKLRKVFCDIKVSEEMTLAILGMPNMERVTLLNNEPIGLDEAKKALYKHPTMQHVEINVAGWTSMRHSLQDELTESSPVVGMVCRLRDGWQHMGDE